MTHFVGLRAKMYSCRVQNGHITKKAKGLKKDVGSKEIDFQ